MEIGRERERFLLAVITLPGFFTGEVELLESMLEAGLEKLHVRKPGVEEGDKVKLLERLTPRWGSRLVLHGMPELASRYGIPQIHGAVELMDGKGRSGGGLLVEASQGGGLVTAAGDGSVTRWPGPAVSTSVHSWKEFEALPAGLAYAFISPIFDSISKPGYRANEALLGRPEGSLPCMPVGLGGIGADTIGEMISKKWKGAAVLGWVWEEPWAAVKRYEQLKKIIDEQGTNQ
jgi:thiamine-phosphate pyrophosphorylase